MNEWLGNSNIAIEGRLRDLKAELDSCVETLGVVQGIADAALDMICEDRARHNNMWYRRLGRWLRT